MISQLGQTPAAGRAITQVAARLAENDPAVRDTARALQDALKARQDAQYALGLEQSKPFAARNSAQEEALKAKLRANHRGLPATGRTVAGAISALWSPGDANAIERGRCSEVIAAR